MQELEAYRAVHDASGHHVHTANSQNNHAHKPVEDAPIHSHAHSPAHDGQLTETDKDHLVHLLLHYLEEIKEQMIPYGMHTFGKSTDEGERREMIRAIVASNPEETSAGVEKRLLLSGKMERDNLIAGLAGRYVAPGGGNSPLRNPAALPTGRNLYGLNPNKLPSKAAWNLGKKAAGDILSGYIKKHGGYPQKVAVVLWAVELLRNEGVNESTILYLMGIRPRWQVSGRVAGLEVIPRKELGRPRVDVMINGSGLYRDLFPEKLEMLDEAVQLAIRQADLDNLLSKNSRKLHRELLAEGFSQEDADEMSRMRVFAEESGSYGNGVGELASASSLWEDERDIGKVYNRRSSFAFGKKQWSRAAPEVFKANLASVEVVVHSSSSNVYGLLDNDDMYQYLGGLAMAVRQASGKNPETVVTSQKEAGKVRIEDLAAVLGKELRSRYFNPKWIEGMKKEDYAGARAMAHYIEYLWGWQVTTPNKVNENQVAGKL